jgi:putative flavoprotein involved in K+ transport
MRANGVSAIIVGGGPAGLAAAASLKQRQIPYRVLERAARVGDSWRAHYDRLHLHTDRRLSALPGLAIPSSAGQWVSRDDFVAYQEDYARHHRLVIEHGVSVSRIERGDGDDEGAWRVTASTGVHHAHFVIVAAGYAGAPAIPDWAKCAAFEGELLHASRYKNAEGFHGRRVLVVGAGNTGSEIALDLAEHGVDVSIAVRTGPAVLRRSVAGVPAQATGILVRGLPVKLVDAMLATVSRLVVGDLRPHGMPAPSKEAYSHFLETGATPILDMGFVKMLTAGKIRAVPAVAGLVRNGATLLSGEVLEVDAVLLATGYTRALDSMVGHLGVLDERGCPRVSGERTPAGAPGLYFVGYSNPISGNLREIAIDAQRIARHIARSSVAA